MRTERNITHAVVGTHTWCETACAIGITQAVPPQSAVAKVARDMFRSTDTDGDGCVRWEGDGRRTQPRVPTLVPPATCPQVSSAEFVQWAKTSVVSQGLISAFKSSCPDLLIDKKKLRAARAQGKPKVANTSLSELKKDSRIKVRGYDWFVAIGW